MSDHAAKQRFFVVHLAENDRPSPEKVLEIQILDSAGRTESTIYAGIGQTALEVAGQCVPRAVIQAARRQSVGQGDYVNAEGKSIAPF